MKKYLFKSSNTVFTNVLDWMSGIRLFSDGKNFEKVLRDKERKVEYPGCEGEGLPKELFANQVASHSPIQETWGEATLLHNGDMMFGVFDGTGGAACSQVVAKRIFQYIGLSLAPKETLQSFLRGEADRFKRSSLLTSLQDELFFLDEYSKTYDASIFQYAKDLLKREQDAESPAEGMVRAFQRLDYDLSKEAMDDTSPEKRLLSVGMTGTCATVLHVSGTQLTTATAGDALVVIGTDGGEAKVLSPEHNAENSAEVERVLREHPGEDGVLKKGLLLGALTSFRSFGNFRYKWSRSQLEEKAVPVFGREVLAEHCLTPPYVTAEPEVREYSLQPEDSFVVIATDGIWDVFPPEKVVKIISNHKPPSRLRRVLDNFSTRLVTMKRILRNQEIKEEREVYGSPATQLILEALDATTKKLHLPRRYFRDIRDDMTVLVIRLDKERLKNLQEDEFEDKNKPTREKNSFSKMKNFSYLLN